LTHSENRKLILDTGSVRVLTIDMETKQAILTGNTSLGIEFGSTRIKAILIDDSFLPIASGSRDWENRFEDGVWTYHLDDVRTGLQDCYKSLAEDVQSKYGIALGKVGSIGISAMMHGYLVFDKNGEGLVPFRTWRNTITEKAAAELTALFNYNIPQRWSIAHLYQAILNREQHLSDIAFITTLAGYVHWKLSGEKVLGLGDAAGMFPFESGTSNYNQKMMRQFDDLSASHGFSQKLTDIFPRALKAGENAGVLSAAGAGMLDPSGVLEAGLPLCPPEGDASTGMVATNSIRERSGNVSAGTSIFAMAVLEKDLSHVHSEIDPLVTPVGKPVAVVHGNNCLTDLDAWVRLFGEAAELTGGKVNKAALYDFLYYKALEGEADCGGLISYNYCSGEHITGFKDGRPLFVRLPDSRFTLANCMRSLLYSAIATLKLGVDILIEQEQVHLDCLLGHGGLFKTQGVAQKFMAAALNTPVSVMDSAGEGGAWGIALLAAFMRRGRGGACGDKSRDISLEDFLDNEVFSGNSGQKINPDPGDVKGFKNYMEHYIKGLSVERAAVENLS
jgi:sugar (pentulose or hexulose) kinase